MQGHESEIRREVKMTDSISRSREISDEDEIDLKELLGIFWRRRLLISAVALACFSSALILAFVMPKKYTATTVLQPVQSTSSGMGGAGSFLSEYKGLASLAGVSMPGDLRKEKAIALLKSRLIAEKFIRTEDLLPTLYSSRWNARQNKWRVGIHVPTLWEGSQYLKKIARVSEDSKTGLVKLSVTWKNSAVAAKWANDLVALTNEFAQNQAVQRARRDIRFLDRQAKKTQYVEERQGIFSIMQDELTKEMMAKGTRQYLLTVIDPAFAPEKPSFPKPILWSILGLLVGFVCGCTYALARYQAVRSADLNKSLSERERGVRSAADSDVSVTQSTS